MKSIIFYLPLLIGTSLFAQESDTIYYEGNHALGYRYLPYKDTKTISEAIFLICRLDSATLDSIHFQFQVQPSGRLTNINISGKVDESKKKKWQNQLNTNKIFKKEDSYPNIIIANLVLKKMVAVKEDQEFNIVDCDPLSKETKNQIMVGIPDEIKQTYSTDSSNKTTTFIAFNIHKRDVSNFKIVKGNDLESDRFILRRVKRVVAVARTGYCGQKTTFVFPVRSYRIISSGLSSPVNFIAKPGYRLRTVTQYMIKSFSAPAKVNDNNAVKEFERHYFYTDNSVSNIKYVGYRDFETDSVNYLTRDSVRILRDGISEMGKKLFSYHNHFRELSNKKKLSLHHGGFYNLDLEMKKDSIFLKSSSTTSEIGSYDKRIEKYFYQYEYGKDNRLKKISRTSKDSQSGLFKNFSYADGLNYTVSSSAGNTWIDNIKYTFNEDGYLVRKDIESDTNATVITYEYEKGTGNASIFENGVSDLINLKPIIY